MGTRADFYVGRGPDAEWLGSIAYDGYPDGTPEPLLVTKNESDFRSAVEQILAEDDSATRPQDGWPWPWEDSRTTDYAYTFDNGEVWVSSFGSKWARPNEKIPDEKETTFPDMTSRQKIARPGTWRSGLLVIKP